MNLLEIYTTPSCGFCAGVKDLLTNKTTKLTEIDVGSD